jgi:alanine racemase
MASPVIWAEIDLSTVKHNVETLKKHVGDAVTLTAVVKADAYGHGAPEVAKAALSAGAERLAVARFCEAQALRNKGINAPILIFGHTPPELLNDIVTLDITPAVNSLEEARELSENALEAGKKIPVHLKIDTGMGRLGLISQDFATEIEYCEEIFHLKGLEIEGIFTHFANADVTDKSHVQNQLKNFQALLNKLEEKGHRPPLRHAANSAATLEISEAHLDMVRPGIALYGLAPSAEVDINSFGLKPALSLKARVIHVKEVPADFKVSYGSTHTTTAPSRIATIPVGYADGYSRRLSSCGSMLVKGKRAPILGRVCMDLTMIDVTNIPGVERGDEVVLIGRQGNEEISADELAELSGTINYEVVSALTGRVKRVYKG